MSVPFFQMFYLGKVLTTQEAGTFFLLVALATGLGVFCKFGMDSFLLREVSVLGDSNRTDDVLYLSETTAVALAILTFIVFSLMAVVGVLDLTILDMALVSLAGAGISLIYIYSSVLQALGYVLFSQVMLIALVPSLICAVLFFFAQPNAIDVFSWYVAISCGTALMCRIFLQTCLTSKAIRPKGVGAIVGHVSDCFPYMIFTVLSFVQIKAYVFVLGIFGYMEEVAFFHVAERLASIVALGLVAINVSLAPKIFALVQRGEEREASAVAFEATVAVSNVGLLAVAVFYFFGDKLLSIISSEYLSAYPYLMVIALAQLIGVVMGPIGFFLLATGASKEMAVILTAASSLGIIVAAVLIPYFGGVACAVGFGVSLVVQNLLCTIHVKRSSCIEVHLFSRLKG